MRSGRDVEPGEVSSGSSTWRAAWKHPMFTDAAILLLVFAAGYGLRAWIPARQRRAIRKVVDTEPSAANISPCFTIALNLPEARQTLVEVPQASQAPIRSPASPGGAFALLVALCPRADGSDVSRIRYSSRTGGHSIRCVLLQPPHLGRQQTIVLLPPIEIGGLANPGLAADLRHRHAVVALLQNKRLLGVRKLRGFHRLPLLPAEGIRQRKTLTNNGPVFRPQISPST